MRRARSGRLMDGGGAQREGPVSLLCRRTRGRGEHRGFYGCGFCKEHRRGDLPLGLD